MFEVCIAHLHLDYAFKFTFVYSIFTLFQSHLKEDTIIQFSVINILVSVFLSLPFIFSLTAGSNVLLGDGLVLVSAALYAVSNLCQEHTVKNLTRVEFLGMMGFFGTLISGVQM